MKIILMKRTSPMLSDGDLLFMVRVLMPGYRERQRMVRTLREDEDILEAMLADEKLFRILSNDPQFLLQVSAHLFFTVLLNRVKMELQARSYTIENDFGAHALVFDSAAVAGFLEDRAVRNYLADMLVSFVRINSYTIPVRVRKGIWRKYRFSDYDIETLMRYSELLSREQRFPSYKRIADICLFTRGIFHDQTQLKRLSGAIAGKGKQELENYGRYFYRAAAEYAELMEHQSLTAEERRRLQEIIEVLLQLSEHFAKAVKPLTFMANHYLEPFKEELFLQH
ncbi:MAG: hypothetical protein JXB06_06145 [Spirochaetales bacterium]|nr:hypothetical protein [Spirochaetales bacterium]